MSSVRKFLRNYDERLIPSIVACTCASCLIICSLAMISVGVIVTVVLGRTTTVKDLHYDERYSGEEEINHMPYIFGIVLIVLGSLAALLSLGIGIFAVIKYLNLREQVENEDSSDLEGAQQMQEHTPFVTASPEPHHQVQVTVERRAPDGEGPPGYSLNGTDAKFNANHNAKWCHCLNFFDCFVHNRNALRNKIIS